MQYFFNETPTEASNRFEKCRSCNKSKEKTKKKKGKETIKSDCSIDNIALE